MRDRTYRGGEFLTSGSRGGRQAGGGSGAAASAAPGPPAAVVRESQLASITHCESPWGPLGGGAAPCRRHEP